MRTAVATEAALGDVQRQLGEVSAELEHVLDGCVSAVVLVDRDGRFLRVNEVFRAVLGYERGELADRTLFDVVLPADAGLFRSLVAGSTRRLERPQQLVGKDGEIVWTRMTLTRAQPDAYVVVFEDRSELRLLQDRMAHMALHDMLTGLPNRQYFTSTLETELHRGVTVCHLDLDGFTALTGRLGRRTGDAVLMHVAQRLRAAVAAEHTMVARFGADDFAVLMPLTQPEMIVRHLRDALRPPIEVSGHEVVVTAAIGVVSTTGASPAAVLDAAELALTRARGLGPGRWWLFGPDDREHATAEVLRAGRTAVAYRPLHELRGRQPVGYDAVLASAESSEWDRVQDVENWLLREVCAAGPDLPVHVAVPAPDPVEIERITTGTSRRLDRLYLSVPAGDWLMSLADIGVGIEIRDFGLADIAFLEALPISAVRLDRRLRQPGLLTCRALPHVLDVVRSAGASVIVDGLATWHDAERWQELGADIVAVGRPGR
ncbi:diguanylate cyclase domain-containing protein [Actinosynnema sp. ALI-1.44]|uniref:diguanylate cyclase domain-containing protein n=1 Tax=Actinosynnema sp. ALI-1.44 TaxID=1933779 RepID=UPI00143D09BF|nr:diguanylate cyclase [Actinosynnema sp. ALI-1.44]